MPRDQDLICQEIGLSVAVAGEKS